MGEHMKVTLQERERDTCTCTCTTGYRNAEYLLEQCRECSHDIISDQALTGILSTYRTQIPVTHTHTHTHHYKHAYNFSYAKIVVSNCKTTYMYYVLDYVVLCNTSKKFLQRHPIALRKYQRSHRQMIVDCVCLPLCVFSTKTKHVTVH